MKNYYMALYNLKTSIYSQHVRVVNAAYDYMSISCNDQLFQGMASNTVIKVQSPLKILQSNPEINIKEDDNPVLIKYRLSGTVHNHTKF